MTVYFDEKRKRWRYNFTHGGRRYHKNAIDGVTKKPVTSERAAQFAENAERAKAAIAPKVPRGQDLTVAMAVTALTPEWTLQPHWVNRERYVREIVTHFGPETFVTDISSADVDDYVSLCRTRPIEEWRGGPKRDPWDPANVSFWRPSSRARGPATINLYLGVLRKIFDRAGKVRDETGEPVLRDAPEVPHLKRPKRKARPIPEAVLSYLMSTLPQHVIEAMAVTLMFGFRRNEAVTLEVHQIDFDRAGVELFHEGVKNREDAFLPGSPEAMAYLARLVEQAHARGTRRLITWRRYRKDPKEQERMPWLPIKRPKGSWARAMRAVEAKFGRRWRWHDVRASFITHVAMTSGQFAAQTLARHGSYSTTRLYVEAAEDFTRQAANRVTARPSLTAIPVGGRPQPPAPGGTAAEAPQA